MNSVEHKLRTLGDQTCRHIASKAIYSSLLAVVSLVSISFAGFIFTSAARGPQAQTDAPADAQHSSAQLAERSLYRRAVEAVIWGMPAVNCELMFQAMIRTPRRDFNQVVYWSRPVSWKNQTLTPNPDTIYLMPFYNTKDVGPMVLEIPPADEDARSPAASTTPGRRRWRMSARRAWTRARAASISSCRRATRRRRPTATSPCRRAPTQAMRSCAPTSRAAATPTSPRPSPTASASSSIRCRKPANPPETKFVDAIDVVFDSTIPYDLRFFQTLDRFVQREPWLDARQGDDRFAQDRSASRKASHSTPTPTRRSILNDAAREAHAWLDLKYEGHLRAAVQ